MADIRLSECNVRCRSLADMMPPNRNVCFSPESGHQAVIGFLQTELFDY